jgi:hypothetical protein
MRAALFGISLSIQWQSFTSVSGQKIGHIFKGQEIQQEKKAIYQPTKHSCI